MSSAFNFNNVMSSSMRYLRENQARQMCQPMVLTTFHMPEAKKQAYYTSLETQLAYMLEEIRLDYEVGPLVGPSRREWYEATRGRRSVESQGGTPGRLAWRKER